MAHFKIVRESKNSYRIYRRILWLYIWEWGWSTTRNKACDLIASNFKNYKIKQS